MTTTPFLTACWYLLALTFPLFGVQFFRFNQSELRIHIALPMAVLAIIMATAGADFIVRGMNGIEESKKNLTVPRRVLLLGYAFLGWHVVGLLLTDNYVLAFRELNKLALGLLCLNVMILFFPRDVRFLGRFWIIVVWSATALFGYLIYQSVGFNTPYMVSEVDAESRAAKNQLAGMMVYVLPFAIGYVSHKGAAALRPLQWIPAVVFSTALLYNGSRGGWVAAAGSLLIVGTLTGSANRVRRFIALMSVVVVTITAAYVTLEYVLPVERLEYYDRLRYMYDPASVPELDTWNERGLRIRAALRVFSQSPIIGVGLGNTGDAMGTLPHNDYLMILSDLGLVGMLLFGGIIFALMRPVMATRVDGDYAWLQVAWRAGLVGELVFMLSMDRIYSTTLFWAFVGMALVASEIETQAAGGEAAIAARRQIGLTPSVRLVGRPDRQPLRP
jgi:O-antigen ligase